MVFFHQQLQEKLLYVTFIDLTKAFDFMSRDSLFKILANIGCPLDLLSLAQPTGIPQICFRASVTPRCSASTQTLPRIWFQTDVPGDTK